MIYSKFGKRLKDLRKQKNWTLADLSKISGVSTVSLSRYENNSRRPIMNNVIALSDALNVSPDYLMGITDVNDNNSYILKSITNTAKLLDDSRQKNVLQYTEHQLNEQNSSIQETTTQYNIVEVVERLSAGLGYAYGDNEKQYVQTNRNDLKAYDIASLVHGNSMYPQYNNGDVALIQNGYDNVNGAIYAVDYNGESFIKKVYFEGNRIRLVSINREYEDIYIYLPIEDGTYLNIIGKVVDSFTPVK